MALQLRCLFALPVLRALRSEQKVYISATCLSTAVNLRYYPMTEVAARRKIRMYSTSQSVDPMEMKKFQTWSMKWWDEEGVYSALHAMNDVRVPFIRDILMSKNYNPDAGCPLSGVRLLDVGCGGGLLSEPLGRLGATVTGVDPLEDNIKIASQHKSFDPVLDKMVQYKACSLEELVEAAVGSFDAVVASEVLEHVIDVESFIQSCYEVLKPGGSLFITTINKTKVSYALGIVFAEKIMGIVPEGTHDWEKFIPPEELERLLESNGFVVDTLRGMLFNPLSGNWSWIGDTSINYALHAVKAGAEEQAPDMGSHDDKEQPHSAESSV
ncbi:ubiquinone biosynthesis O-methyltransferase, mitochondrial [Bombina bombina]|uniref:ubiquinone biosynthesis O-methyltransferase, mitochondrial n=1 Tax=Bombina bombina TaxID=8345 RepID=UPI00235AEE70|nr:ubiquinone biosynthesis O-methyltransferase, mitochondrial [Bombina bombina]